MRVIWKLTSLLAAGSLGLVACGDGDGNGDGDDTTVGDDVGEDTTQVDTTPPPPECTSDAECAESAVGPLCDLDAGSCIPLPLGHQIGWRDGSADSVVMTELYRPPSPLESVDLDFHKERNELWVVQRQFNVEGICAQSNPFSDRCSSLDGEVTIIFEPGTPNQAHETRIDGNAWHFMRRPPALAMGTPDRFATCGEANTGNFEDDPTQFIGPSLWSTDLSVFAKPSGGNGSHMDMLHATAWCMGIAWEKDNVYWLFNGDKGSIDRYDFAQDHGPGNDDHSDGQIRRYVEGDVFRVEGVPSHMEFNPADSQLYIADTGGARILKLDTRSGSNGGPFFPVYEPLADSGMVNGATLTEVVPGGTLNQPSGLAIMDNLIFITDHATSRFYAYDMEGNQVRVLETDFPPGSLSGIEFGPDGKLYFSDMLTGAVYRLDPQ